MYINQHNFDWAVTERELVIFVPNYRRKLLFDHTIKEMYTEVPTKDWIIIIGNDGVHEDHSDLEEFNVKYFTLERPDTSERNGNKIRNFCIKRCKSKWLFQRDPEILYRHDYIATVLKHSKPKQMLRCGDVMQLTKRATEHSLARKIDRLFEGTCRTVNPKDHTFMHYGCCLSTELLQSIHGYDECFTTWGYEDTDLFHRLQHTNCESFCLTDLQAIHMWHPPTSDGHILREREVLYKKLDPKKIIRNGEDWGNG